MYMVIHFVWEEKLPDVQLFTDLCTVVNGLAGYLGTWKEHDQKIDEKHIWGEV